MNEKDYGKILEALNKLKWPKTYQEMVDGLNDVVDADALNKMLIELVEDKVLVLYNGEYYLIDNQTYAVGSFRLVRSTFGFVENEKDDIYVSEDNFHGAMDMDEVLVKILYGERKYGVVIGVLSHQREFILGTIEKVDNKVTFVPYDRKITSPVVYQDRKDLKLGDRVIGKIKRYGKEIEVEIVSVLGHVDEPGIDVLSVLFVYGIDSKFPPEALDQANKVPDTISEQDIKGRVDHRDQYVITIDGEDAKDLDDAIYMESLANGYRLYVHIADVSHYVPKGTPLDKAAYDRSSSVYMVDRVVPMLPKVLSNGICSLHPHVDRLTLTCQVDIGFDGTLMDYHVYPSVIQSKRRYSYNEVNGGKDLGEATEMIDMMMECMEILEKKRRVKGALDFDSDESKFVVDHEGKVLDIYRRERGEAEVMIECFMITANEAIARLTKYSEIPMLYRVHEEPDKEKMQEVSHILRILGYRLKGNLDNIHPKLLQTALEYFEKKPEYPVVSKMLLRSMSKARYAPEPIGHFGLALEDYTHFTSPIRRYPDLLLHQALRRYLFDQDYTHLGEDESFAVEASLHVSQKERSILEAERQVEKIKKCEYMQDKVGETYKGIISGITNFGMFIELDNTVEGIIPLKEMKDDYYVLDPVKHQLRGQRTGQTYQIGQKVNVKVESVDMIDYSVVLRLIKPKGGRRGGYRRKKPKGRS